MISDKELKELKEKSIDDLKISEKFLIIQSVISSASVDYKSKWWLDVIFDDYISKKYGYKMFNFKNNCSVTIMISGEYNSEDNIVYVSDATTSTRHDAMLNALTIYCKMKNA